MPRKRKADSELGMNRPILVDEVMAEAGINVEAAKKALESLARAFPAGIPPGALQGWVDGLSGHSRAFWSALGREWASEE